MKSYLAVILILCTSFSFAQEQNEEKLEKRKELHLRITDFSPFRIGFGYKHQVKPKGFVTISLVNLGFGLNKPKSTNSNDFTNERLSLNGGIQFGYEFRKEFKEKFTFYHGPNLLYSYSYVKNTRNNPNSEFNIFLNQSHTLSIPYNIGIMYQVHKNILLSAQLSPSISFRNSSDENGPEKTTNNTYNFGFQNFAGTLAIAFRFNE